LHRAPHDEYCPTVSVVRAEAARDPASSSPIYVFHPIFCSAIGHAN
jgi:hypothetical protein